MPDEDPREAVMRELWEETGVVNADYLGETDWMTYEFPPYDGPPSHRLAKFRGQRQKWFALRFTGRDEEIDPLTPRNGQPAGIRCVALGAARPRRRSRRAVPARGVRTSRGSSRNSRDRATRKASARPRCDQVPLSKTFLLAPVLPCPTSRRPAVTRETGSVEPRRDAPGLTALPWC